ncbi:MAG: response regulator transcription factor [Chloroflexota bacterium]
MTRLLIAEDELKLGFSLEEGLNEAGYTVDLAVDGDEALAFARCAKYDAMVLDILLPRLDGLSVCRQIRQDGALTPILMLTARDSLEDKIRGLDSGADDYLTKPFNFSELLARVRALVRRGSEQRSGTLALGQLTLDPASQTVAWQAVPLAFTRREYTLLETLMRRPEWIVPREAIIESVWGFDYPESPNLVDVYIGRLRRKLREAGTSAVIDTVRGLGYRMREGVD